VTATPSSTTAYRLATSTVAAGSVTVKVMPIVTLTTVSSTEVSGTVQPAIDAATVTVQVQNPDLTWTTAATGATAADGTFAVPATLTDGATVRVLVTPTTGYAPGTSTSQIVSG
jgi:hypothetical protein